MAIRPFRDQDRAEVLTLVGDPRTIDSPGHHLHVAEDEGAIVGAVVWLQPDAGDEAYLGSVTVNVPDRWDLFYSLVRQTALDAQQRGFTKAVFTVHDPRLLRRLERDFIIDPQPSGWNPVTHEPVQWRVAVDLADALRQLERVI